MAQSQSSPGTQVTEQDFSITIPSVTSSVGAMVFAAEKGPLNIPVLLQSPQDQVNTFGEPDSVNYPHWFSVNAFLGSSDQFYGIRTENAATLCAGITVGTSGGVTTCGNNIIESFPTPKAASFYPLSYNSVSDDEANIGNTPVFLQEYLHIYAIGAGPYYEGVQVVTINSVDYTTLLELKEEYSQSTTTALSQAIIQKYYTGTPAASGDPVWNGMTPPASSDAYYTAGNYLSCSLVANDIISSSVINGHLTWFLNTGLLNEYTSFEYGPQPIFDVNTSTYINSDEFTVYVFDPTGTLQEQYLCSNVPGKVDDTGNLMFAPDVINNNSAYIYFFIGANTEEASGIVPVTTGKINLAGADPLSSSLADLNGEIEIQWRQWFANKETLLLDVFIDPDYPTILKQVLDDISGVVRQDCFSLLNVPLETIVNTSTFTQLPSFVTNMKNYVGNTLNIASSYSAIYGQYFQVYDSYNQVNRWVPVTGYVAATIAKTDFNNAQWYAPAGLNRGVVSGVISVAINPTKAQRDVMYVNRINPIVNFTGQGIVIWGQKTLQGFSSAFDRINVRRLFLFMERTISQLANYFLFELNDSITQSRFAGLVNGFLANIQSNRGITAYQVICDSSNNTPDVVDANEFVAEILVKPTRAIEFISLVFTAVSTGVSFSEVVGA